MRQSEQVDKIAPAFLAAQRKFKQARKDGKNPHFNSVFSTLENIFDASKEALNEEGIAILQPASGTDGVTYGVETVLMHTSGQWFAETLMLKPVRPDPQAAGSAITYAKRYGAAGMLGLGSGDDDDGNAASGKKSDEVYTGDTMQQMFVQQDLRLHAIDEALWLGIHEQLLNKPIRELSNILAKLKGKK